MSQKVEKLLFWQEQCSERISRIAGIIVVIFLVYIYSTVLYPVTIQHKTRRYQASRNDLGLLIQQFGSLQGLYQELNRTLDQQSGSCNPLVQVRDGILPQLQKQTLSKDQRSAVDGLDTSISSLLDLYNKQLNSTPISSNLEGGMPPVSALVKGNSLSPNQTLTRLVVLEEVIRELNSLNASSLDSALAEKARSSPLRGNCAVQDRLTLNVPIFTQFDQYVPLPPDKLKFEPSQGLKSYVSISRYVGAPLAIESFDDLQQLDKLVAGESERVAAALQTPYQIPVINISIDRGLILILGPFTLMVLFHGLATYVKRNQILIQEIESLPNSGLTAMDFLLCDPGLILQNKLLMKASPGKLLRVHLALNSYARLSLYSIPCATAVFAVAALIWGPYGFYSLTEKVMFSVATVTFCTLAQGEAHHVMRYSGVSKLSTDMKAVIRPPVADSIASIATPSNPAPSVTSASTPREGK